METTKQPNNNTFWYRMTKFIKLKYDFISIFSTAVPWLFKTASSCLLKAHRQLFLFNGRIDGHHFSCNVKNSLVYVHSSLRTDLKPLNLLSIEPLDVLFGDLRKRVVAFVDEDKHIASFGVVFDFFDPKVYDILKWFRVAEIIDQNNSLSPFVVWFCDASKPLLASCVPDLQLGKMLINH